VPDSLRAIHDDRIATHVVAHLDACVATKCYLHILRIKFHVMIYVYI